MKNERAIVMKRKNIFIITSIAALVVGLAMTVAAAYDSSSDPLITLSYLRDVFKSELMTEIDEKLADYSSNNYDAPEETGVETESQSTSDNAVSQNYEVIELTNGDALYAVSACEIILRSGSAVCTAPDANQGIADMTDASEIYNGYSLGKNHLCLIPRGDGRGVVATSESVYIMVRGDYTIVEN